ncbi:hypothetical protein ACFE04_012731 [Oxalis oulophora]
MWTQGKEVIVVSSDDEVDDVDMDTEENFNFKNNQTGSHANHQSMSEPIVYADKRKGKEVIYADMDVDVIHIPTKQEGLVIRDGSRKEHFTDKGKGKAKVVKVHDDLLSMDSLIKDAVRGLMQLQEINDNSNLGVSRLMEQNQNQDNKVNSAILNKIMAKGFALKLAEELRQKRKTDDSKVAEAGLKLQNNENPRRFENAYEMIIKRAEQKRRAILLNDIVHRVPCSSHSSSKAKKVPSLLDLSCDVLAKNVEKLMSLKLVPDELRSKLSQAVSDYRKLDANFAELLVKGDPVEIRVRDGSYLKEEELLMIFSDFDAKWLTFLQLDLCGNALSDEGLRKIVIQSLGILPSLVKVSLRGAYRLTNRGLNLLAQSTPELQSLNLTESGLITNDGINNLTSYLASCDEAVAAFLETSGQSLTELSLNHVGRITENFINGHPNLEVEILGLPLTSLKTSWIDRKPSN